MARPALEIADIFRDHDPAWRSANRGHVSHGQLKVMSAIERCRTASLGGHVARCENEACARTVISYNSCAEWVVYAKRPFAGPEAVLAYLSRYTHRVAISNSRLIEADKSSITFKYKDYRLDGPERYKTMTLESGEFIRRFLMHVLPKGFHRIRHYGLFANGNRAENIAKARALLAAAPVKAKETPRVEKAEPEGPRVLPSPCPCCGGRMIVIEVFARGLRPKYRPPAMAPVWKDTS